jgi:hypothetical protein
MVLLVAQCTLKTHLKTDRESSSDRDATGKAIVLGEEALSDKSTRTAMMKIFIDQHRRTRRSVQVTGNKGPHPSRYSLHCHVSKFVGT